MQTSEMETLIQEAISKYREGTASRWAFAEASEKIVGRYERGATLDLAARCGISTSMCEDYARAGLIWKTALMQFPEQQKQLERMRAVLPISHWTTLADLWKRLEFELYDGLTLLEEVAAEDKIITVMEWRSLLLGHFADGGGKMEWQAKFDTAIAKLGSMVNDFGCPETLRSLAQSFLREANPNRQTWSLIMEGERPVSWNVLWESRHWRYRKELANKVHQSVRAYLDPEVEPPPSPVDVLVIAYLDGRQLDVDNIMVKPYLDGLKGWWIRDDTPECVRSVQVLVERDNARPRLEIYLTPIPGAKPWKVEGEKDPDSN